MSLANFTSLIREANFSWTDLLTGLTIGEFTFTSYLDYRQYNVLNKKTPPESLKGAIDDETFEKSQLYGREKLKFASFNKLFGLLQSLATIKYNLYAKFWNFSGNLLAKSHFLPSSWNGIITHSVYFFALYTLFGTLISLPFSYYNTFKIEGKFGFNKHTLKSWSLDKVKEILISLVIGLPIVAIFFKIVDYYGESFPLYGGAVTIIIQLILQTIVPNFITPLFFKYSKVEEGELRTKLENLASEIGFPLNNLYVIDGSSKSSHSNAFFSGLPWSKQIVLFDTLINHSTPDEITAVLAHELGHWKMNHIAKALAFNSIQLVFLFYLSAKFLYNDSLYREFGFSTVQPPIVGFCLFSYIFEPINCALTFGDRIFSRHNEYEADKFANDHGYKDSLIDALIKLDIQNLITIDADWLYSSYHHSHPILPERLSALGYLPKQILGKDK
ncbi:Piso0_002625 [Millerozyma farinosa CBS 7064]|uniref:CAAX prenyl protease n=1 Tax=Pichia sorbitophila (strain ATCC MYA-4447 / BCRC 22081 / CBS 7064 / NBRC 10061 / NRRL Y-12695) TaxID=559304 RepID=G8YFJ5_PICSO|nr:Piso0_002625 [Millerozyma farinosa CBS 7064]